MVSENFPKGNYESGDARFVQRNNAQELLLGIQIATFNACVRDKLIALLGRPLTKDDNCLLPDNRTSIEEIKKVAVLGSDNIHSLAYQYASRVVANIPPADLPGESSESEHDLLKKTLVVSDVDSELLLKFLESKGYRYDVRNSGQQSVVTFSYSHESERQVRAMVLRFKNRKNQH